VLFGSVIVGLGGELLMSQIFFPKDDNLRLVFSKDHQEWLDRQIRETRHMILGSVILMFVLSAGLIGALQYSGYFEQAESCVVVREGQTLQGLQDDGLIPQAATECQPNALRPVPFGEPKGWLPDEIGIAGLLGLLFVLIMIPASIVDIIRNSLKLREFKKFAEDHEAFLRKYNRL